MSGERASSTPPIDPSIAIWEERWPYAVHHLKCDSPYFQAVRSGYKTFEVRRNDRGFQPADLLVLHEITFGGDFTGEQEVREVPYVLRDAEGFGVAAGFVVLSLASPRHSLLRPSAKTSPSPGGSS